MSDRGAVLRVITRLNIGGPARHVAILNRELPSHGYRSELAAGIEEADEGTLLPDTALIRIPSLRRPISVSRDVRAFRAVRHLIANRQPQIVHTHLAKAGFLGRLAASQLRVPISLHTFHGHVFDGYFSPARAQAVLKLERWISSRTTALVAVSESVRDELLDLGIGRPSQWHVIPLGLELAQFANFELDQMKARERIGLPIEGPIIGCVGRLVAIKDHPTFLAAADEIARNFPSATFVVAGDGELRAAIESQVPPHLQQRFRFLGWVDDLPALYRALDVIVLTSRNEGTPVALIEAGATGVPSVATDVGGVRDVVRDTDTGFLVSPGNPHGIARSVSSIIASDVLRDRMGSAAKDWVVGRFAPGQLVESTAALYEELLHAN